MNINSSITELKGIGEKTGKSFEKLGVYTVGDILLAFPRDYKKYECPKTVSEVVIGEECAICVKIAGMPFVKSTRGMNITIAKGTDATGIIQLLWFHMPYIKSSIKSMVEYIFYGKISSANGQITMEQPNIFTVEQYNKIQNSMQPVYSLVKGVTNHLMVKTMRQAISVIDYMDYMPEDIIKRQHLISYEKAFVQIHFPDDLESLIEARKRLVFDEFFLFILQMQMVKQRTKRNQNHFALNDVTYLENVIKKLPYTLTTAQANAVNDILSDMNGIYTMQRLLQGDVGSGKTIVAYLAMICAAHNGYQSAIMAPTEVLARQHFETFTEWNKAFGINLPIILLTGTFTAKEKRLAYEQIENSPNALIIGTHALIQEKVLYQDLALVVTDEQHRFGVRQREIFAEKGMSPHILVMSATPIPRTLAIILYGDLDITVIDELPANRLPIKNCVVNESYRPTAWNFIRQEIEKGHQAYIICPLVEESENMEAENVMDYAKKIEAESAGGICVGYLHGKMKSKNKNTVMEQFLKNEIQVLVSTTVIEVGVNVPNATVMMVENSDRFGLAQLHQLRGRVGRGDAQSYCIMVNSSNSRVAQKRLEILNKSNDGFYIAKEDLKLRGPGDFFGMRQSGIMEFKIADVFMDAVNLAAASEEVGMLLKTDFNLVEEKNSLLKKELERCLKTKCNYLSI